MTERLSRDDRSAKMRADRRAAILGAAMTEAARIGYAHIGRDAVASLAGVAQGSVNHEFVTVAALRDAVVDEAVATNNLEIIAQAIANRHDAVQSIPPDVKAAALHAIA